MSPNTPNQIGGWSAEWDRLRRTAERQLFFVGGAPRSGTTWLQALLDAHPDVVCRGEGLFQRSLAAPIEVLIKERRQAIEAKNAALFVHTGGFTPPQDDAARLLWTTGLLHELSRLPGAESALAIGEKTPENIFFFPSLKAAFPGAKFIGIARDPRDVLASAWRFFERPRAADKEASKSSFIERALPSIVQGARALLDLPSRFPGDAALVTYEALTKDPVGVLGPLFTHLGASADEKTVRACVEAAAFERQSGRAQGVGSENAFHGKGLVGDWPSTFSPAQGERILEATGWMFPAFGWPI